MCKHRVTIHTDCSNVVLVNLLPNVCTQYTYWLLKTNISYLATNTPLHVNASTIHRQGFGRIIGGASWKRKFGLLMRRTAFLIIYSSIYLYLHIYLSIYPPCTMTSLHWCTAAGPRSRSAGRNYDAVTKPRKVENCQIKSWPSLIEMTSAR